MGKKYKISAVIRDKKGRITHAKIGNNIFDIATLYQFYSQSDYRFVTSPDMVIERDVLLIKKKGGRYYFATEADWTKENNLDYLQEADLY